jgi:hypothetical protein
VLAVVNRSETDDILADVCVTIASVVPDSEAEVYEI